MSEGPSQDVTISNCQIQDEWLWGWDATRGIVSAFAEPDGRVLVWRRLASDRLVCEHDRYRPWLLLASLEDLEHLGSRLCVDGSSMDPQALFYRELAGHGELRFLVRASDFRTLTAAVLQGARQRTGRVLRHVSELGAASLLWLTPEEQYLVDTGRTYFRDLDFGNLRRVQFDLETTGLDAATDRILLVALRAPDGQVEILEADTTDSGEAGLIGELVARLQQLDPDIIENHNLHGFDLPFLVERVRRVRVPLSLGRYGPTGLRLRPAATGRGIREHSRRMRYTVPGRELIDTLDAKHRARELPEGTQERFATEAMSAAMKLVINSAYGYLGAVGLTRFADVHAANQVTRHGREVLTLICRELLLRGMTLLEADTDGVYFAVPEHYDEDDERRVVSEVAALLPPQVRLEFEGRYAAMLSHEPKNYALLTYPGKVLLRGVAFRSSRAEPFGVVYYVRTLRQSFATRLERAFTSEHFELLFADPQQPSLFEPLLAEARPVLKRLSVTWDT